MSFKKFSIFKIDSFKDIILSFLPDLKDEDLEDSDLLNSAINKFLNECIIDISLNSKLIVFAKENFIQIYYYDLLISNQIPKQSEAYLLCQARFNLENEGEITCISIISIFGNEKDDDSLIDFPCLFIGFNTGYLRIYTKALQKIFQFKFLETPILKIKFQTFCSNAVLGRESEKEYFLDELLIYYYSSIIRINGSKLVKLLKKNKYYKDDKQNLINEIFYEIWKFNKPETVEDFIFKSNSFTSYYDNLVNDCLRKDFKYSNYNSSNYVNSLITTGTNLYLGFYELNYNKKEVNLMSIFSSFVFPTDNKINYFLNNLTLVNELVDEKRIGKCIKISPNKNLALVYDQLDRMVLVDLERKEMIRMWKGYSNCQFSFIETNETNNINKKALFICLYLDKKGYLEIWPAKFGDIICKIDIGINCQLFYKNYYMLGMNNDKDFSMSLNDKFNRNTLLFDFNTFQCFILEVSFLCSLGDFNITSKDAILMNEIPGMINMPFFKKEELNSVLVKINEPENKLFILKYIIEKDDLDLLYHCISIFKSGYSSDCDEPFYINCNILLNLLFIFEKLNKLNKLLEDFKIIKNVTKEIPFNPKIESEILKWDELDFSRIISLFSYGESLFPQDVDFESLQLTLSNYLNNFIFNLDDCKKETCLINFNSKNLSSLSHFMFSYLILVEKDVVLLDNFLANGFKPLELVYLLFYSWSEGEFAFNWKTWKNLFFISNYLIIKHECNLAEDEIQFKNELVACLRKACKLFLNSKKMNSAIVGSYTIQVISNTYLNKKKSKNYFTETDDEWVTISLNEESFSLILKQLEDIYLLNLLLQLNSSCDNLYLSLMTLNNSKKFTIAKIVSKYFVKNLIETDLIIHILTDFDTNSKENLNSECNFTKEVSILFKNGSNLNENNTFIELFRHVRNRFPFDLNLDILLTYCGWFSIENFMQNISLSKQIYLQLCLSYLDEIKNENLKHKIACLIWRCFVLKMFTKIKNVLFKPNNTWKLTSYEYEYLSLDEPTLELFSQFTHDLLHFILNTIDSSSSSESFDSKYDQNWALKKNHSNSSDEKSILDLALGLPDVKFHVVLQNYHLALITFFLTSFKEGLNFKLEKIFPEAILHNLPNDLNGDLDEKIGEYHKKFQTKLLKEFCIIVAKSVPAISVHFPNDLEKNSFMQANSWINKLIELAKLLDININIIKNAFVYSLYRNGCDRLAKEVLYTINDEEFLGKMFIELIVPRLYTVYGNEFYKKLFLMPPEISNEFSKKKIEKVDFETNFECTKEFIECILSKLSSDSPYLNILTAVLQVVLQENW